VIPASFSKDYSFSYSASIIPDGYQVPDQQGSFMLVNDLRGLVIPASFSKDYSCSYSASIIPDRYQVPDQQGSFPWHHSASIIPDGYQGPDQQASFMPVKDLRSW